jgi:short-subunit dehydrogenase
LVTGATAGIGYAFAHLLAAAGHDLVVVARDVDRLDQVARQWRLQWAVNVTPLPADLSCHQDCARVEARLSDAQHPVDVLINNAGFGLHQAFTHSDLAAEQALLDVLVRAVMRLSHAAAGPMAQRGHGTLINVSSVAGWWPHSTYCAAKAYVTCFSQALHRELRPRGVTVMALCPGFTRTEFHRRGRYDTGRIPAFMWLDADRVVATAWRDAARGKSVSIPSGRYKLLRLCLRWWY